MNTIKRALAVLAILAGGVGGALIPAGPVSAGTWTDWGWHAAGAGSLHCVSHEDAGGNQFWCDAYPHSGGIRFSVVHTWLPAFCKVQGVTSAAIYTSIRIKPAIPVGSVDHCAAYVIPSPTTSYRSSLNWPFGQIGGYTALTLDDQVFSTVGLYQISGSAPRYGTEFLTAIYY